MLWKINEKTCGHVHILLYSQTMHTSNITAVELSRLDVNTMKLRLVALRFARRTKALRWRTLEPGKAKAETLALAQQDGVIIRRIARAIEKRENPVKRTEYYRRQKQARRASLALEGGATISIRLTRDEQAYFGRCLETQSGNGETFLKRALLTGSAFLANAGNSKGGKTKIRKFKP